MEYIRESSTSFGFIRPDSHVIVTAWSVIIQWPPIDSNTLRSECLYREIKLITRLHCGTGSYGHDNLVRIRSIRMEKFDHDAD